MKREGRATQLSSFIKRRKVDAGVGAVNNGKEDNNHNVKIMPPIDMINDHLGCQVYYYDKLFTRQDSLQYYDSLLKNCPWADEYVELGGKIVKASRQTCSYGKEGLIYEYTGKVQVALPWTSDLLIIKKRVEDAINEHYKRTKQPGTYKPVEFNFALMNYYANGKCVISEHSDDEEGLIKGCPIASVSFGVARDFVLRKKIDYVNKVDIVDKVDVANKVEVVDAKNRIVKELTPGSLIVMDGNTQKYWKHGVPARKGVDQGRINITLRCVTENTSNVSL